MTKAAKIRRYLAKGMTPTQIIQKLGCSSSEVYRLVPKKTAKAVNAGGTDPKANAWKKRNPWFGQDEEMTSFALGLHKQLTDRGVDPRSDEYYEKIDARIRERFPRALSKVQIAIAKRLGMTPEAYAHEVTKLETPPHANELQIGGEHYKALNPQPWDVISAWNLGFLDGNVVKYVARFRNKGGVEDLKKAKHYLDKLIEQQA